MKNRKGFFINDAKRQHLNLAPKAMAIIETDMIRFNNDYEKSNRSGFMNIIIQNYHHSFPLSESVVLKEVNAIKKTIQSNDFSHKLAETIIEQFTDEMMKNAIIKYINQVQYGETFKLKLNSENVRMLSTLNEVHYFEKYAPRSGLGFYLKALIENYTHLPKEKREEIYFASSFEKIKSAIHNDEEIILTLKENIKIRPLRIVLAKNQQHNELRYIKMLEDNKSFLNGSISIKEFQASGAIYKKGEDNTYWQDFKKEGHFSEHYLFESRLLKETIIVRFTDSGLQRFLREEEGIDIIGIPNAKDKNLYTFKATEPEAFFQLFKFGPQAEVISPQHIRNNFQLLYRAADNCYKKTNDTKAKGFISND
jgi:hypothetical protein